MTFTIEMQFDMQLAVRIPKTMKAKLQADATARLLSPADIVREIIREHYEAHDAGKATPAPAKGKR